MVIGVPEAALLRSALAAYVGPLVGLLAGAILGQELAADFVPGSPAGPSVLLAAAGFALALRWVKRYSRRMAADPRFRTAILRVESSVGISVRLS